MIKPILEKFVSEGDIEVLKINDYEFALRKITTGQANYLNTYFEYFRKNPESFLPFIEAIVIDADKPKLKMFLNPDGFLNIDRLHSLIYAICIQSLSLRPLSLDYTLSNAIVEVLENYSIINRFIKELINFGYKKSEIDEFSNSKIIKLTIEEYYTRDKAGCLIFLADITNKIGKEFLPLTFKSLEKVEEKANQLIFNSAEMKEMFLKNFYEAFNQTSYVTPNKPKPRFKQKTEEELREELAIKKAKAQIDSLPK